MRAVRGLVVMLVAVLMLVVLPDAARADIVGPEISTLRLAGLDRYATAVSVSSWSYPTGAPVAFVATGEEFADALASAPAAALRGGPLLLVPMVGVPVVVWDELVRLSPSEIVVVGGEGAVSRGIETRLNGIAPVRRIGGQERFETAAKLALDTYPGGASHAVIATGETYADALSGAPAAAALQAPVLLVWPDAIPAATASAIDALGVENFTILGGSGAVSDAIATQLATYGTVKRVAGIDRYETSASIAREFFSSAGVAFVASGAGFADALAGAAAAGALGMPLLLSPPDRVPAATIQEIERLGATNVIVMGGPAALPEWIESWLAGISTPLSCNTGQPSATNGVLAVVGGDGLIPVLPTTHRYVVEVEVGLPVDLNCFAASVEAVLGHAAGWSRSGKVSFQRVDSAPYSFVVILASPHTTDALCHPIGTGGIFSCRNGTRVVLNHWRWETGAADFGTDLTTYRFYLVNHEVGHALGQGHRDCPSAGTNAPVMMQQTKTTGSCIPNGFPLDTELATLR